MRQSSRLDVEVVSRGLAASRSKAQAMIMAGQILVNGTRITKAGSPVQASDQLRIQGGVNPYASRGGLKLEGALKAFDLDPSGWDVVDVGASTGGFTDCWLQHGARHVWSVDVGYGQLDWKLRTDSRVSVHERTNARWLSTDMLGCETPPDAASIDASFIGIALLLKPLLTILKTGGLVVGLVKPQFEAGPAHVGKHGVVRDRHVHEDVLARFADEVRQMGYSLCGLDASPIRGPEGNIEFLSLLSTQSGLGADDKINIKRVVDEAWDREERL